MTAEQLALDCDPNWRDSPAALNRLCEQGAQDRNGTRPEPRDIQTIDLKGGHL